MKEPGCKQLNFHQKISNISKRIDALKNFFRKIFVLPSLDNTFNPK